MSALQRHPTPRGRVVGRNLKVARARAGLTQREVAEALGCSPQAYSLWERGQVVPCGWRLVDLSRLFGVSVADLERSPQ